MTALPNICPSLAEVAAAIEALPEDVRADLRKGPLPNVYQCQLCYALRGDEDWRTAAPDSPVGVLWRWHESHAVIRARAATNRLTSGAEVSNLELDTEERAFEMLGTSVAPIGRVIERLSEGVSYYRCLTVYLLAGWRPDGVAELPGLERGRA